MAPIHAALLPLVILVLGLGAAASDGDDKDSSLTPCDPDECPRPNIHHFYAEVGCVSTKRGPCTHPCPTLYDCSLLSGRDHTKCYHRGKELSANLPQGELYPSACVAGCRCRPGVDSESAGELQCAHIECPSLFDPTSLPEGCVETYSSDTCCSDGVLCQQNATEVKCEYGGKTYLEGQRFYPNEAPCKRCTCMKGFDGTLKGPWCTPVDCGYEVHYASQIKQGCAPVFLADDSCCPIDWRCPEESDSIEPAMSPFPEGSGTCPWGSKVMQRGEKVIASKNSGVCERCRCEIPPRVTCDRAPMGGPCVSDR